MNCFNRFFALHLQLFYLPLTICAGYYSRDCAGRAEGSVRTVTSYHRSGGSSQISFARSRFRICGEAAHPCGGWALQAAVGARREDREAAYRLRFKVFNIEMGEGLERSYETGIDTDHFDVFCEHLLVEDKTDGRVVGTYRMQSGSTAAVNLGYYSAQEFEFAPYEPLRRDILELGRASIDREHRTPEVLTLLWRGIAQYANEMGLRYLIGCSSLNSKDPGEGWQMYRELERYRVSPEFETMPTHGLRMSSRAGGCERHRHLQTRRVIRCRPRFPSY